MKIIIIHMRFYPVDDIYLYYARSREIPYTILDIQYVENLY